MAVREVILAALLALAVAGSILATGCQVEMGGMTLPSGRYLSDDVQYFPPGPRFPLANEEAALEEAAAP